MDLLADISVEEEIGLARILFFVAATNTLGVFSKRGSIFTNINTFIAFIYDNLNSGHCAIQSKFLLACRVAGTFQILQTPKYKRRQSLPILMFPDLYMQQR